MFSKDLVVNNKTGLHARPASDLCKLAKTFNSKIEILVEKNGQTKSLDAKSVIKVMAGGISQGTPITLKIEGDDEEACGKALVEYIENLTE